MNPAIDWPNERTRRLRLRRASSSTRPALTLQSGCTLCEGEVSDTEREKWDRRYSEGEYQPRTWAAPFLEEWIGRFPPGRALDVACGAGRNALRLAEAGFTVDAVDISQAALDMARKEGDRRGLRVSWQTADLDYLDLPTRTYDLITVIRYRNLELWPRLIEALQPDGWLLAEHHMKTRLAVDGPPTPEFRLDPGEYLKAFSSLRIVHYSESIEPADRPGSLYALERLVACKGDPGW
jgi:SAM-dependent methyltransferase